MDSGTEIRPPRGEPVRRRKPSHRRLSSARPAWISRAGAGTAGPVTARPAVGPTWFQLKSADLGNACIVERGNASAVAGAPCSSNHSDYWEWTSSGQLLNTAASACR